MKKVMEEHLETVLDGQRFRYQPMGTYVHEDINFGDNLGFQRLPDPIPVSKIGVHILGKKISPEMKRETHDWLRKLTWNRKKAYLDTVLNGRKTQLVIVEEYVFAFNFSTEGCELVNSFLLVKLLKFISDNEVADEKKKETNDWVKNQVRVAGGSQGAEPAATLNLEAQEMAAMSEKEKLLKAIENVELSPFEWIDITVAVLARTRGTVLSEEWERLKEFERITRKHSYHANRPRVDSRRGKAFLRQERALTKDTPIVRNAKALRAAGMTVREIGEELGRTRQSIYRYLEVAEQKSE